MKRLILLAALVASVWGAATLWSAGAPPDLPVDPTWPVVTQDSVERIDFAVNGGDAGVASENGFVLVPGKTGWLAGPRTANATLVARADSDKIVSLLEFVSHNKPVRRLGPVSPDRMADYGLDRPAMSIIFSAKQPWVLHLGDMNPAGDGVYAGSSLEENVLLLDAKYAQLLERGETFYHDLRLMDAAVDDVVKVRVTGPGAVGRGEWQAEKGKEPEKTFVFTWPDRLLTRTVSQGELDLYLHSLLTMKGAAYVPGGLDAETARKTMPGPYLRVEVWLNKAKAPQVVELYDMAAVQPEAEMETRFVTVSDWQTAPVELDRDRMLKLSRTAFSLMERKAVDIDLSKVVRQRVVQKGHDGKPAQEVVAIKKDNGWVTVGEGNKEMVGMDMLTWRLTDLKYEAEPVLILPDSAQYALTWELYGKGDKPQAELVFYLDPKLPEHLCWLKLWGEDRFYPVTDKLLEDLQGQLPLGQ